MFILIFFCLLSWFLFICLPIYILLFLSFSIFSSVSFIPFLFLFLSSNFLIFVACSVSFSRFLFFLAFPFFLPTFCIFILSSFVYFLLSTFFFCLSISLFLSLLARSLQLTKFRFSTISSASHKLSPVVSSSL